MRCVKKFRRFNYALKYFRCSVSDFFYSTNEGPRPQQSDVVLVFLAAQLNSGPQVSIQHIHTHTRTQSAQCTHHIPKFHFRWETWDSLKFLMTRKHIRQRRRNTNECSNNKNSEQSEKERAQKKEAKEKQNVVRSETNVIHNFPELFSPNTDSYSIWCSIKFELKRKTMNKKSYRKSCVRTKKYCRAKRKKTTTAPAPPPPTGNHRHRHEHTRSIRLAFFHVIYKI